MRHRRGIFVEVLVLLLAMSGCKLLGPKEEKPKVEPEASRAKAEEARQVLSEGLGQGIQAEAPGDLRKLDVSEAHDLYREAAELDPSNSEAHFGLAVTEILMILQNDRVQEALDSLSFYLGEEGACKPALGLVPNAHRIARSPLMVYGMARRLWPSARRGAAKPALLRVSDLQEVVEQEVIPALDRALEHLEKVEEDEVFRFYITPEMFGEEEGDSLELDLGEVYVLDAQVRLFRAWLLIATAYNLDFDDEGSYAFLRAESDSVLLAHLHRLDQSPTFLTLRSGDKLPKAKEDILSLIHI